MLEQSLKTNDNLYMAVLTGCLRIARESEDGYETILNYGIAYYKRRCKVMVDKR